jgi:hypothetical protein
LDLYSKIRSDVDSNILDKLQIVTLLDLCEFNFDKKKFNLLYRGSLHGFKSSKFHAKCDNIPKTLTVIKDFVSGNIFGGYTEATWNQPSHGSSYKEDKNAFIFSLVNKEKTPVKVNIAIGKEKYAICAKNNCGPVFGKNDIDIDLNNLDLLCSYSFMGNSYILPNHSDSAEARCFLTGVNWFKIEEIEVFQVQ